MTTERFSADERSESSKKLQTSDYILKAKGAAFMPNEIADLQNDARIAHEQRDRLKVISECAYQLKMHAHVGKQRPTTRELMDQLEKCWELADSIIKDAAPFLED